MPVTQANVEASVSRMLAAAGLEAVLDAMCRAEFPDARPQKLAQYRRAFLPRWLDLLVSLGERYNAATVCRLFAAAVVEEVKNEGLLDALAAELQL
jgi:hypothetical protein